MPASDPARAFMHDQQRAGRARAWLAAFWGYCAGLIAIGQVFCIALVLSDALGGDTVPAVPPLAGYALGAALRAAFLLLADQAAFGAATHGRNQLRLSVIERLLAAGPALLRQHHSATLAGQVTTSIEAMEGYYARFQPAAILAVLLPATVLAAAILIDARSGLIMLAGGVLVPLGQALSGIGAKRASERQFIALQRLQTRFVDRMRGIATIVLAGAAARETAALQDAAEALRKRIMRVLRVAFLSSAVIDLAMAGVLISIAISFWGRIAAGGNAAAGLVLLLLVGEFFAPLRAFAAAYQDRLAASAAADQLASLPPLPPPAPARRIRTIEARGISVTFDDVSFTWDQARGPALSHLSFFVGAGELAVLSGRSGAGKSTIIELLLGFIRPDSGQIRLNGLDITDIVPAALTELTCWIGQKPMLFAASIADNIAFARPGATRAEIEDAARAAQVTQFADTLPRGLQTRIGEGGHGLSGGQAQRVAIARAFLRNAPLLLLDEPTAHLDPLTESAVLESLKRLSLGRTVLLASHAAAAHAFGGRRIELGDGPQTAARSTAGGGA